MTTTRARVSLLAIFITSFVIQSTAVAFAFMKGNIYSSELLELILVLLQVYSVPLAIILGGIFGGSFPRRSRAMELTPSNYFWSAFMLALVWNVFLLWRSVAFGFVGLGNVTEVASYLKEVSSYSVWLVAGCLAFYFSKR